MTLILLEELNSDLMMRNILNKQHRTALILLCTFLATACTGPLVVGSLYDGAANRAAKQLNSYADFTDRQQAGIDNDLAAYHSWHRHTQLPLYGDFILTIANDLESETTTPLVTVKTWIAQADVFSNELRRCSPLNTSGDFLKQLTDKQVQQIAKSFARKHRKQIDDYNRDTATKRLQKRQKNIIKWIRRAGLEVNKKQEALLTKTLAQQINLQEQRQFHRQQWSAGFISILEKRDQQNFSSSINLHITSLRNLIKTEYPEHWQFNANLRTDLIQQYLNLQTPVQRQLLIKKAKKFAATIKSISAKNKNSTVPRCYDAAL